MYVSSDALISRLYVLVLEIQSRLVGIRNDEKVETERKYRDQRGGEYIRHHHPVIAYTTGQNGDYLGVRSHLGCEEDDRNEHEQRTEHVHEVWYEIDIIVEDDSLKRSLLGNEIVDLLTDVEDDDDADYKKQRHEEGAYELLRDITVYLSRCKVHFF